MTALMRISGHAAAGSRPFYCKVCSFNSVSFQIVNNLIEQPISIGFAFNRLSVHRPDNKDIEAEDAAEQRSRYAGYNDTRSGASGAASTFKLLLD